MVLAYLALPFDYQKLIRLLRIRNQIGTPFFSVRELSKLSISVTYRQGTLIDLHAHLTKNLPCIAGIQTGELPYWRGVNVQHAVVVVGIDGKFIYLNDPEFSNAPIQVALGDFDLAWLEQGEHYAVLAP